jgi:hypothetical protein
VEEKDDIFPFPKDTLPIENISEDKIYGEIQDATSTHAQIPKKEDNNVKDGIEARKGKLIACPFCGKVLSSDMTFCLRCGQKIKE